MPDITDPQVIKWVNEELRPRAEDAIRMLEQTTLFINDYNERIAPLLAGNTDAADDVVDGRGAEGVSRLTLLDISNFMGVMNGIEAAAGSVARTRIRKPTVRPLRLR